MLHCHSLKIGMTVMKERGNNQGSAAQINVRPLLLYIAKLIVEDSLKKSSAREVTNEHAGNSTLRGKPEGA